jgi:hypothetical protein
VTPTDDIQAPGAPDGEGLPALDPTIVEDDEALGAAVDAVILPDPGAQGRGSDINEHTASPWAAVDGNTWKMAVKIDAGSATAGPTSPSCSPREAPLRRTLCLGLRAVNAV